MYLIGDVAGVRAKPDDERFKARDYVRIHVPTMSDYVSVEVDRGMLKDGERVALLVRPGVSKSGKLFYQVRGRADLAALAR
jgi:hypothetical protein